MLTLAVGKTDCQSLCLRLAFANVGSGIPNPTAVAAYVGRKLHIRNDYARFSIRPLSYSKQIKHTVMVGADLERLVSSHDETGLAILLVLQ